MSLLLFTLVVIAEGHSQHNGCEWLAEAYSDEKFNDEIIKFISSSISGSVRVAAGCAAAATSPTRPSLIELSRSAATKGDLLECLFFEWRSRRPTDCTTAKRSLSHRN